MSSVFVSAETYINDSANEDTLIIPAPDELDSRDGSSCDSDDDHHHHDSHHHHRDDDDSMHGYERWDEHFAKERAKRKREKDLIRSSESSNPNSSKRSRFGLKDRSLSLRPKSLFRLRKPKYGSERLLDNHRDADFASDSTDGEPTEDEFTDEDSLSGLVEPSDSSPAHFLRSRFPGSHRGLRKHRLHDAEEDDDDFHDGHDEDAPLRTGSSLLGRRRRRPPLVFPNSDADERHDNNHHSVGSRLRRKLFFW